MQAAELAFCPTHRVYELIPTPHRPEPVRSRPFTVLLRDTVPDSTRPRSYDGEAILLVIHN